VGQGAYQPPYDAILICVKAYDVDAVIGDLQAQRERLCLPNVGDWPGTQFVCLQNGVGSEERFAAAFGSGQVVAGTTTSPVTTLSPAVVRVERAGGAIALAPLQPLAVPPPIHADIEAQPKARDADPVARLVDTLHQSKWPVRLYADYRALKWSKLLLNILGNATCAILDMPASDVYADARLFGLEMRMLREAVAVMNGLGIHPVNLPRFPAATLALAARLLPNAILRPVLQRQVTRGRGDKRPSLFFDVVRQTGKSEVIYLNGAVAAHGRALGIPTPVNACLTEVLMGLVSGEFKPAEWRGQVEKLLDSIGS
jgi:2-dehydropantoate 2-reductase